MVLRSVSNGVFADGCIVFIRGQTLLAQRVNRDLSLDGEPVTVAQDAMYDPGIWRGAFSVSRDGRLSYHSGPPANLSSLHWVDRHGDVVGSAGDPDSYWDLSFSPDHTRLLMSMGDPQRDCWVQDLARNSRTKITLNGLLNLATWAPDSAKLYIDVLRNGDNLLVERTIAGSERVLARGQAVYGPRAVTPDGKTLILETDGTIERMPLDPPGKPTIVARSGLAFPAPAISPNGKWLAYASNETGRSELFVISMQQPDLKWQVSSNGGQWPRWRSDGKELYFVDPTNQITASSVTENGNDVTFGSPQALFTAVLRSAALAYDVAADGQKFLVDVMDNQKSPTVVVISDWKTRLPR
jgi:Tol biopolymer transport system component